MNGWSCLLVAAVLFLAPSIIDAPKDGEFEAVWVRFIGKFYQSLQDDNFKFDNTAIENDLVKTCQDAKGKENRFCYYIDAATKIINEVSKPLSYHVPVDKICELKYDKRVNLSTVDLKKLNVKDLKKILEEWGETCKGCAEKSDFIRKINKLMPKNALNAAEARSELPTGPSVPLTTSHPSSFVSPPPCCSGPLTPPPIFSPVVTSPPGLSLVLPPPPFSSFFVTSPPHPSLVISTLPSFFPTTSSPTVTYDDS